MPPLREVFPRYCNHSTSWFLCTLYSSLMHEISSWSLSATALHTLKKAHVMVVLEMERRTSICSCPKRWGAGTPYLRHHVASWHSAVIYWVTYIPAMCLIWNIAWLYPLLMFYLPQHALCGGWKRLLPVSSSAPSCVPCSAIASFLSVLLFCSVQSASAGHWISCHHVTDFTAMQAAKFLLDIHATSLAEKALTLCQVWSDWLYAQQCFATINHETTTISQQTQL